MQMEEQVVEKANEVEQYWQRMQELEEMYSQLKKALGDERQARDDEEALRKLQARCTSTQHSVYTSSGQCFGPSHYAEHLCVLFAACYKKRQTRGLNWSRFTGSSKKSYPSLRKRKTSCKGSGQRRKVPCRLHRSSWRAFGDRERGHKRNTW